MVLVVVLAVVLDAEDMRDCAPAEAARFDEQTMEKSGACIRKSFQRLLLEDSQGKSRISIAWTPGPVERVVFKRPL